MRFPKMRPQVAMELKVPDLAGGINLRDGLSEVLDNQLTDCKNMWWKDGLLQTRPGIEKKGGTIVEINVEKHNKFEKVKVKNFPEIKHTSNNVTYCLQVEECYIKSYFYSTTKTRLYFNWVSDSRTIGLGYFETEHKPGEFTYFVCCKNNVLYCFTNNQKIYKYDINGINNYWEELLERDCYIPTVYSHCKPVGEYGYEFEGTQIDGFNILSPYYKVVYSTVNIENTVHRMRYKLPVMLPSDASSGSYTITAEHTYFKNGWPLTTIHTVEWKGGNNTYFEDADHSNDDGLYMFVNPDFVMFSIAKYQEEGYDTPKELSESDFIEDNLVITAVSLSSEKEKAKVFNMTRCEWFGGAASGIKGGTRLFLCGNSGEEKSLVCWSGLNDPLYFSENSYFYVGDTLSAVTGFGKQSDKLIIFKENETWYTNYQQSNNTEANSLIKQSVMDYSASSVYFPLIQINANIGCGYPDTIQLCRNRLIWLGSNSKVYTLVSESQYNERNIFCVSEIVESGLKKYNNLQAIACDWNGYYCLFFGSKMYLMDYNSYGYTHISSYSKTEDANIRIPWYFWEFSEDGIPCVLNDNILFAYAELTESGYKNIKGLLSTNNKAKDIESNITTKLFDFGQPSVRKNVDKINLQLGNNGGEPITVKIITECGEENQEIFLTGNETQNYTPGYIESKAIFPCIRQTVKIGLELSSTGVLAIDGMSFKYRTTGGAR